MYPPPNPPSHQSRWENAVNNASKININAINLDVRDGQRDTELVRHGERYRAYIYIYIYIFHGIRSEWDMMLWRSDGDEKLLPSLAARPSVRVQRYYYFWVWGTYTYSVHAHTRIHCHHIYKGARARTYTHTLVYIFYVHIQSTARGDMWRMSEGRVEQETIDWCRPVRPLPRTIQPSSRCGAEKGALWLMAVQRAFPGKYYYTASTDTLQYYYTIL